MKLGISKYLPLTNHQGLENRASNFTCLTKICKKLKEKPFLISLSLDCKYMASVFVDGDTVLFEKRSHFKKISLHQYFSPKTLTFRENEMRHFRCWFIDGLAMRACKIIFSEFEWTS